MGVENYANVLIPVVLMLDFFFQMYDFPPQMVKSASEFNLKQSQEEFLRLLITGFVKIV